MRARIFIDEIQNGFLIHIETEPEMDERLPLKVESGRELMQVLQNLTNQRQQHHTVFYAKTIKQATRQVVKWYEENHEVKT